MVLLRSNDYWNYAVPASSMDLNLVDALCKWAIARAGFPGKGRNSRDCSLLHASMEWLASDHPDWFRDLRLSGTRYASTTLSRDSGPLATPFGNQHRLGHLRL